MPIDYENHDEQRPDSQKEYTWTCPWPKCCHVVRSYTEGGLIAQKEMHSNAHDYDREKASVLNLSAEDRIWLKGMKINSDKKGPEKGLKL